MVLRQLFVALVDNLSHCQMLRALPTVERLVLVDYQRLDVAFVLD